MKTRLILCCLALAAVSCSHDDGALRLMGPAGGGDYKAMAVEEALEVSDDAESRAPVDVAAAAMPRKLIREGGIMFETRDAAKTRAAILAAVKAAGGYVSTDNSYAYDDRMQYNIVVRVPATGFDTLFADVSRSAWRVERRSVDVQDVTEQFVDIQARLKTKKELEGRYTELMRRATKVEEMLSIEREMGALRSDIESFEGRLKYLSDRVDYSTLDVAFYEMKAGDFGFWGKVGRAVGGGWDNLQGFLVRLVYVWPFVLLVAAGLWLFVRARRRRRRKNAA